MAATAPGFAVAGGASDILSGIFGYLASGYSSSIAQSQASMIMTTAQANEARYALMAKSLEATQATDYAASGVKVSGSPIDVLDQTAQIAQQNEAQILMAGEEQAQGVLNEGAQAKLQGRMSLLSGLTSGILDLGEAADLSPSGGGSVSATSGGSASLDLGYGPWGGQGFGGSLGPGAPSFAQ